MAKRKKAAPVGDIVRHAASMQQSVDKIREELQDRENTADTVGGKVTVTVTCAGHLRRTHIDPGLFEAEGLEMALDLIVTAANKALDEADRLVDEKVTKATGGLRIPGINA